jgi:hypothetical protein
MAEHTCHKNSSLIGFSVASKTISSMLFSVKSLHPCFQLTGTPDSMKNPICPTQGDYNLYLQYNKLHFNKVLSEITENREGNI